MNLKSKSILFTGWGCENPRDTYMHQIYYLLLKKIFPQIETFDSKKIYFQLGKEKMNELFLETIQKKDYDLILFAMEGDEFFPETLKKMRELCKIAKFVIIICDDDARFDSWSRYIGLFFDYVIISQDFLKDYKKDRINAFFHYDYNTYQLEPMNVEKIYDVTFIGRPKADRNEVIKCLINNGVKITIFGWDWYKYPEFKDVYKGPLNQEDYAKVINQSKINLSPSKAGYSEQKNQFNMKGRYYEVSLCKSFQLIERFPTLLKFFNEKEIGMYDSEKDLLEKVKYYLKNDKERERLAENAYKKTTTKYNREKNLTKIFNKIFSSTFKQEKMPEVKKKIVVLTKKDLYSDLKEKLKDADYVTFVTNNLRYSSPFKDYFLARALDVTGKNIACCDYSISPLGLRDYMIFISKIAFKRIGKEANKLIDLNQLIVKKNYLLGHLSEFQNLSNKKTSDLIEEKNTAFISIPLVSIRKMKMIDYEKVKKAFEMRFQNDLFSLIYQKRILTTLYPYLLILKALKGNLFILKYLKESIKEKANIDKLSVNKAYIEKSFFEKITQKKD